MWVTYFFERAIIQEEEKEDEWYHLEEGDWTKPFPNVMDNSTAFGLEESLSQSDHGFALFDQYGELNRIVTSKERPSLLIHQIKRRWK